MWRMSVGLIGALALCGCQTAPRDEVSTRGSATVHPGDAVVSAVGTPFYLIFKGVVCVASVALAAPVAGLTALSDSRYAPEVQATLGDGLSQNCGPPYVLRPYRTVSVERAPEAPPTPPTPEPERPPVPGPAEPKPLFPD
jgi:hypothetical protein